MYLPDPILRDTPMSAVYAAYRSIAIVFTSIVEHYNPGIIKPSQNRRQSDSELDMPGCRDPWQGMEPNHWLLWSRKLTGSSKAASRKIP